MLTEHTEAKIDHGLAKLAKDQLEGNAPPPGQVTQKDIAERSGVSEATISNMERMAMAKLQAALLADPEVKQLVTKNA